MDRVCLQFQMLNCQFDLLGLDLWGTGHTDLQDQHLIQKRTQQVQN